MSAFVDMIGLVFRFEFGEFGTGSVLGLQLDYCIISITSMLELKPRACHHTCSAAATPPATGGQARLDRGSHQDGRFLSTVMLVHAVTFSQSSVSRHDFSCLYNKIFNGFRFEQSVSGGAPSMPFRSTDTALSWEDRSHKSIF